MKHHRLDHFSEVWVIDFEFFAPPGERPRPICMVGREYFSGRIEKLWFEGSDPAYPALPFSTGLDTLVVAYYASAEIGCFIAQEWEPPVYLLDLFTEHRCLTNATERLRYNSLVKALLHYGLPALDAAEKDTMRDLAIRGGPFTEQEKQALLKYCEGDVNSTSQLLSIMLPDIDLPRALHRGRYMCAVARMEWTGIPVDAPLLNRLRENWVPIQRELIRGIDPEYHVYEGTTFKRERFAEYLKRHSISWPRTKTGKLDLKNDTFRLMARCHPKLAPLRDLRRTLDELKLESLQIGSDNRNRCLLSPFQSSTSRNQPSNSKFIFGPASWIRGMIKPHSGKVLAYIDWCQQEFAIAAALSGDSAMQQAYLSGDPYLTFAKQAGAVPESATKTSHYKEREQFKVCALGVQYGMQSYSLSRSLQQPEVFAQHLLKLHRQTYPRYWYWIGNIIDYAMLENRLFTVFGWQLQVRRSCNTRSLANFPMQANGAEMLRLACCLATERGISVCAPVHDALLIEADIDSVEDAVRLTQQCMLEAGRMVLDGFELRTDVETIRWPDRYLTDRGREMWLTIMGVLEQLDPDFRDDPPA